jgi:hypothetical protein
MTGDPDDPKGRRKVHFPSVFDLVRFAFFCGLTIFAAWIAGVGQVAYTLVMLIIGSALGYALLDLVDMEIVKRKRRG